jgi:LPS export ABC transporter protein LptC
MIFMKPGFLSKSICAAIACMLFFSCRNEMEKITSFRQNDTIPVESALDIEYFYSENAVLKTKMTAEIMNRYEVPESFIELPQGFMLEMFDSLGNITSSISANWARKYEQKKMLEAKYDVVVIDHVENKTLNTNHLIWDEGEDKIFSDKFVKITTPDKVIYGDGFESDQNFTNYRIINTKGEILLTRDRDEEEE